MTTAGLEVKHEEVLYIIPLIVYHDSVRMLLAAVCAGDVIVLQVSRACSSGWGGRLAANTLRCYRQRRKLFKHEISSWIASLSCEAFLFSCCYVVAVLV